MKELAIGEIGVIDGVKVQCCKADRSKEFPCGLCPLTVPYDSEKGCYQVHKCTRHDRSDHTDVYFKRVEE